MATEPDLIKNILPLPGTDLRQVLCHVLSRLALRTFQLRTEIRSILLLLPARSVELWIRKYLGLNMLFYYLYNARYMELIDTLNQLIFQWLDSRI